jgi:hypothetical protein
VNIEHLKLTNQEIENFYTISPLHIATADEVAEAQLAKALWGIQQWLHHESNLPWDNEDDFAAGWYAAYDTAAHKLKDNLEEIGIPNPFEEEKI